MRQLVLVGEDGLCCALGERLLAHALPGWAMATAPVDKQGVTKLVPELERYAKVAKNKFGPAVVCIADTDGQCPVEWLAARLPKQVPERFLMRLAVAEAESWVMADHVNVQAHFRIPANKLSRAPDELADPKAALLQLLWRHAPGELKQDMVQGHVNPPRRGTGYNPHLRTFVTDHWDPAQAAKRSPSLQRAIRRISLLEAADD